METRNVIFEEINEKIKQSAILKCEINSIYDEIRQSRSVGFPLQLYPLHNVQPQKEILSGGHEPPHKEDRSVTLQRNRC